MRGKPRVRLREAEAGSNGPPSQSSSSRLAPVIRPASVRCSAAAGCPERQDLRDGEDARDTVRVK